VIAQDIRALQDALHANTANTSNGVIASQIASIFTLSAEQSLLLLSNLKIGIKALLLILQDPLLTQLDVAGNLIDIIPVNGTDIYNTFRLVHKVTLVILRFKMNAKDTAWMLANADKFGLLSFASLPVLGAPGAPLFPAWLSLSKWVYFEGLYPEPEGMSLRQVFDEVAMPVASPADIAAAVLKINKALTTLTQWQAPELSDLEAALQLQHASVKSDYADINNYLRMDKCMSSARRIGQPVVRLSAWTMRDNETGDAQKVTAQQVWNACKAKYDTEVWLEKVTPLEDTLREKKRDALISYLIANSQFSESMEITVGGKKYPNPKYWRDADDLLKYFLIDIEMCSCQLTSRIKQAISSMQMFVQRCLLGLEQPRVEVSRAEQQDTVSDNSWNQWKWMKSYRIWEANRKIFLYPENWIEPELRDDKSPFFKELESEILQADITDENAEAAFLNYVHKVHEVARLDIVGTYYEIDDTNPYDNLPPDINQLHVIGRTKAQPAVYYYRKFDLNYGEWSAWEKIDLDIQSDQVIPVVYNRRLHLFWLSFILPSQEVISSL
ncbi:MAG: neuraminidase-like domain-containing protein, partial [Methylophilaceae bacterium]